MFNRDFLCFSETLNVATFHWLFNQITNYLDKLMSDKKSGVQWSRRLQLAVGAYREMLECLAAVDRNCDAELRKTAHTLKSASLEPFFPVFHPLESNEAPKSVCCVRPTYEPRMSPRVCGSDDGIDLECSRLQSIRRSNSFDWG